MIRAILFSLFHIRTLFLLEKCYVDNNSQQIFNDKLLLTVIGGQKCNLSNEFKLEPVIPRISCEYNTSQKIKK